MNPPATFSLADADAKTRPLVHNPGSRWTWPAIGLGLLLLGGTTLAGLSTARTSQSDAADLPRVAAPASRPLPPPPMLAAASTPAPPPPAPLVVTPKPVVAPAAAPRSINVRPATPVLIVDLTQGGPAALAATTPAASVPAGSDAKLSPNDSFAARVSNAAPESAVADRMGSPANVVSQGTIISAVLETAINSDLPGMVRAVVSRDVVSFDATQVLVPRGSRLIGQYSSGVAFGQSRAFIIWTRMLRSDGVSVQLGSAATDQLGTAGLSGKVNTHFLRRFGAATLLSVITAGLNYLATRNTTDVLIATPGQANQLATVALQHEIDIPPTIRIAQGTPVLVLVARDLDFSSVQPATAVPSTPAVP